MESEFKQLLVIGDMIIAEDIKRILEEFQVYSILTSDNAASSYLNTAFGPTISENVTIRVNRYEYVKAVEILSNTQYSDLTTKE